MKVSAREAPFLDSSAAEAAHVKEIGRLEHQSLPSSQSASFAESISALVAVTRLDDSEDLFPTGRPRANTKTSLADSIVEELEQTNPGVLAWFSSAPGLLFQALMLTVFIASDTVGALVTSSVLRPNIQPRFTPLPANVILFLKAVSITVGFVITAVKFLLSDSNEARTHAVSRAFGAVFDQRKVIDYALASTLYAVATLFSLLSYSKLDAGHKKILDQFRLILTAGMSSLVLGKRFSKHQWFSLLLLFSAICNFYNAAIKRDQVTDLRSKCFYPQHCFGQPAADICALRVDGCQMVGNAINHRSGHINITTLPIVEAWRTDLQGLVYSLVGTTLNSLGVLFQEKVMKRDASTAFATQKAQIELAGLPIALVMCFVVPLSQGGKAIWWAENETEGSGAGFFQGFNTLALFAIFMAFCNGWMGSLILKQLSSVVQKICKCIIVVSTVLCTSTFLRPCEAPPPSIMMYVLTGMVVCTLWLFASMPSPCET